MEGWTVDMGHSRPIRSAPLSNNVRSASDSDHSRYERELKRSASSGHPRRFHHAEKYSFGTVLPWRVLLDHRAENMIPYAGRHAEITAMG